MCDRFKKLIAQDSSFFSWASLVFQMVKNLPAIQDTQVRSLGWEDPLEKGMATHSSIFLPEEFHGQRSLVGYSPWGCKELDTTEQLTTPTLLIYNAVLVSGVQHSDLICIYTVNP